MDSIRQFLRTEVANRFFLTERVGKYSGSRHRRDCCGRMESERHERSALDHPQ